MRGPYRRPAGTPFIVAVTALAVVVLLQLVSVVDFLPSGSSRFHWEFRLQPHVRRRGVAHAGSLLGIKRIVGRCMAHEPIRVGVVGGSISAGQGVYPSSGPPEFLGSYSRLFYDWLNAACPHKSNTYINGAMRATGSVHFSQCLWNAIPKDLDLVLVDFAVNDVDNPRPDASMELIIRRLMLSNPDVTIVIINWHDHWPQNDGVGPASADSWILNWEPAVLHRAEANFTLVGAYYDAVVLSARNAFLPEMLRETPGFTITEIAANWNHPNTAGHYYLAELIVSVFRDEFLRAQRAGGAGGAGRLGPAGAAGAGGDAQGRPPKMLPALIPGNEDEAEREPGCLFGEGLKGAAKGEPVGWVFKQTKHWGWETEAPDGNELRLVVGAAQLVTVSFTISGNKPFGNATVACEGGCECDATKLLGRTRYPITVMAQRRVPLRGAGDGCTLLLKAEGGRMQVLGFVTRPEGTMLPTELHRREALASAA